MALNLRHPINYNLRHLQPHQIPHYFDLQIGSLRDFFNSQLSSYNQAAANDFSIFCFCPFKSFSFSYKLNPISSLELGVFFVVANYICLSFVQIHAVFHFNYINYSGLLIFCCQNITTHLLSQIHFLKFYTPKAQFLLNHLITWC